MTREQIITRKAELERRRDALVDQLTSVDAASATISGNGGSKSYTNRGVADIRAKIRYVEREIARLSAALSGSPAPGGIRTIYARFDG